jgi:RimJ/RimL family protein N-acetyltransferase
MQLTRARLQNIFVRLEPIDESHREGLRAAAADPSLWTHWVRDTSDWDAAFDEQLAKERAGAWMHFTVFDQASGAIIGQTCYLEIRPAHAGVEIGGTWYAPSAQGGAANPACKLLLLGHAFECGAERVELKTDARNARSGAAIIKLGAKFEGIHRRHMRRADGTMRDTVYFSIIREEWLSVRIALEVRLAAFAA